MVSWCAGLRRHYGTSEFSNFLGVGYLWETASIGNIIFFSGHVSIFINRWWNDRGTPDNLEDDRWEITVIHATEYTRYGGVEISEVIEESYAQSYFEGKNAHPFDFITDTTKPTINISGVVNNEFYKTAIITYSATDDISETNGPFIKGNYQKNTTFNTNGTYTFTAYAEDWAKNNNTKTVYFTIDTTPPDISNKLPTSWSYTNNTRPTISALLSDTGTGVNVNSIHMYIDNTEVSPTKTATSVSYTPSTNLSGGLHDIKLKVSDIAGNQAESVWYFCVDITPPVGSLILKDIITERTDWTSGSVKIYLTASDNLNEVSQVRFSEDPISLSVATWQDYTVMHGYPWFLSTGDGQKRYLIFQ